MATLYAIAIGALSAAGAVLIHQTLPPIGVALALLGSVTAIWWVGRHSGKRRYKLITFVAWVAVVFRAGSFGVGQELLIQGDAPGSALLLIGFLATFFTIFTRV
jgi:hypothetical protein